MQSKDGATKSNTLRERRSDVASGHEKSEKVINSLILLKIEILL